MFCHHAGRCGDDLDLLTVILLIIPKTRKSGVVLLAALCADLILCNGILKNLFARIRPYDINTQVQLLIARPDDFFFSLRSYSSILYSSGGIYIFRRKKLWKMALILACLIAFSRLYLYVHYPTDILGGIFGWNCGRLYRLYCGEQMWYNTEQINEKIGGEQNALYNNTGRQKASYDGSTIIARNDDSGAGHFTPKKFVVVHPEEQPRKYKSVISHVEIDLPEEPMRYTSMPNALEGKGVWAASGVNAAHVGMTATETITSIPGCWVLTRW